MIHPISKIFFFFNHSRGSVVRGCEKVTNLSFDFSLLIYVFLVHFVSCQAMDVTAGCRRTLWWICTVPWSRQTCLITDQPTAWNTSARLSAELTTPCWMTNFTAYEFSTVHSMYNNTFKHELLFYKRVAFADFWFVLLFSCRTSPFKTQIDRWVF